MTASVKSLIDAMVKNGSSFAIPDVDAQIEVTPTGTGLDYLNRATYIPPEDGLFQIDNREASRSIDVLLEQQNATATKGYRFMGAGMNTLYFVQTLPVRKGYPVSLIFGTHVNPVNCFFFPLRGKTGTGG